MSKVADNLKRHGFSPITPATFAEWIEQQCPAALTLEELNEAEGIAELLLDTHLAMIDEMDAQHDRALELARDL